MTGLLDFEERRPKRSSLSAYLGGAEAAEAERAYDQLQAAFAEPLGLTGNSEPNRARQPHHCSCGGAACECHKGASLGQHRSGQWLQPESDQDRHMRQYQPTAGSFAQRGPLGMPNGPSRSAYAGNLRSKNVDTQGLQAEPGIPYKRAVPAGPRLYQPIVAQHCDAARVACEASGRKWEDCFVAWLLCQKNTGLPTIFSPGLWGKRRS